MNTIPLLINWSANTMNAPVEQQARDGDEKPSTKQTNNSNGPKLKTATAQHADKGRIFLPPKFTCRSQSIPTCYSRLDLIS
jgi:hypothetical protein